MTCKPVHFWNIDALNSSTMAKQTVEHNAN